MNFINRSQALRSSLHAIFAIFIHFHEQVAAEEMLNCSRFDGGYLGSYRKEDVEQLRACAEQGHIKAIHKIAEIYIEYDGSEKNLKKALEFYENALQKGDIAAAGRLAEFYYSRGEGTGAEEKAASYAKLAYEKGDPLGSFVYAKVHLYGKGVPENIAEGMKIMRELNNRGNVDAKNFIEKMEAISEGKPHVPGLEGDAPIKVSPPDYPQKQPKRIYVAMALLNSGWMRLVFHTIFVWWRVILGGYLMLPR